jgi:hypothetical protein
MYTHTRVHTAYTQEGGESDRESACYCIAELCTKVDAPAVTRHSTVLLGALLSCCSAGTVWTVRDAACVATGKFVSAFPEAASQAQLEGLFSKWFEHLSEPVWSVREDSAVALGQVCIIYIYIYISIATSLHNTDAVV